MLLYFVSDYLPPSEVGDAADLDEEDHTQKQNYGYMDMSPTHLDNPEYFDSEPVRGQPVVQSIGMNKLNKPQSSIDAASATNGLKAEKTPLRLRSMSDVESEDGCGAGPEHDYYNETDVLNRKKGGAGVASKQHPVMFVPPRTESTV